MNNTLESIGFIKQFVIELPNNNKEEFAARMQQHVDIGEIGMFSGTFESFSSSNNEYKGEANTEGFRIRRRRRMFDMNNFKPIATGRYRQNGDILTVAIVVNGFPKYMYFIVALVALFYVVFISFWMKGFSSAPSGVSFIGIPFILFHGLFMLGVPYFMLRRAVSKMQYDLERELHYIASRA